jgi:hypothetical protein
MKNKYLYVTLLSVLSLSAQAQMLNGPRPRLVVNITIDQLRSGYPALFDDGYVCEQGFYPFHQIDLSSAISSVVTGTSPYYHTITADKWLDRTTLQSVTATPADIAVSTLGDELKRSTRGSGKVYAVATKQETAELMGGHNTDGVGYRNEEQKRWNPINLTDKALQLLVQEKLGRDTIPDLLLLNYDANENGEDTNPLLDYALTKLVNEIERLVGANRTLYVLTSTGYTEERADDYAQYNIPTGTYYTNRTANLLNMYMGAMWGQGKYVEGSYANHIFLNHHLLEQKRITLTDATTKAKEFMLQMSGVKRVTTHLYEPHMGDLVVELNPGWQMQNDDTHEQVSFKKALPYFPILFYGANVPHQKVQTPISIDRIAPTIAKAIRIRAPNACMASPIF